MANYVTHIAEVDKGNLTDQAESFLKGRGVEVDNRIYWKFESPWTSMPAIFDELACVMEGRPFIIYIYGEDPGQQVGEGIVTGTPAAKFIRWENDYSRSALEKYTQFSELSGTIYEQAKIETLTEAKRRLENPDPYQYEGQIKLLGKFKGEIDGEFEMFYVALRGDGQLMKNHSPSHYHVDQSPSGWTVLTESELKQSREQLSFLTTREKSSRYQAELSKLGLTVVFEPPDRNKNILRP